MKKMIRGFGTLCGILASLFFLGQFSASAQPSVVPNMGLEIQGAGYWSCNLQPVNFTLSPGQSDTWQLNSPLTYNWAGTTMTVQNVTFDPDPLISNNVLVQNNTAANQIYTITVALPTTFAGPNQIRGSISTSVIGANAAISTVAPSAIYSAIIDGVTTVKTLQDSPFSLTTPAPATSAVASYGFQLNNVPVTSSIGITLKFELTPGDTATILSDFEVVAVPEPSTLALLLLGGGALVLRRNRR